MRTFFSYRQKYNDITIDAQIQALKVDLLRVGTDTDPERMQLEDLRQQAENLPAGDPTKESLVTFIQRHYFLAAGAGQVLLPFIGIVAFAYVVPVLIWVLLGELLATSILLGFGTGTFLWILLAGSAGGTLRVLLTSLSRGHESRSVTGLIFVGFIRPTVGVILAVAIVLAFSSGFVALPITEPDSPSQLSAWTKGDLFLVFVAFAGGFTEGLVVDFIGNVRR